MSVQKSSEILMRENTGDTSGEELNLRTSIELNFLHSHAVLHIHPPHISTHRYFLGNNCQEEKALQLFVQRLSPLVKIMRQRYLIFLNTAAWERNVYATHSKEWIEQLTGVRLFCDLCFLPPLIALRHFDAAPG